MRKQWPVYKSSKIMTQQHSSGKLNEKSPNTGTRLNDDDR